MAFFRSTSLVPVPPGEPKHKDVRYIGANGQGHPKDEARRSLTDAIALILEERRQDGLRGVPPDAERETVSLK